MDKLFKTIAPKMYLERIKVRKQIEDLENTKVKNDGYNPYTSELATWWGTNATADEDTIPNLETLRSRSRDLYQTNDIAVALMDKYRTKVVGVGLVPKPTIDYNYLGVSKEQAKEWEKTIQVNFETWANSIYSDSSRVHDFYTLQGLAQLSWVMNGDVFCLVKRKKNKYYDIELSIQLIEGDRVKSPSNNPDVIGGVEFNSDGELYKYYIANYNPKTLSYDEPKGYEVFNSMNRKNILHVFEPSRVDQKRGIPLLSPILKTYKQLDRYKDAELMAAVINSAVAMVLKSPNPTKTLNANYLNSASGITTTPGTTNTFIEAQNQLYATFGKGSVFTTTGDEELKEFETSRPSKSFKDFVEKIVEEIGAAAGVPAEVMMGAFKSSYSAAKAALEEAESRFKVSRKLLERKLCQPLYEEFIIELIRNGEINCKEFFYDPKARYALSKCVWIGAGKSSLDPSKDAKAAETNVKNGVLSRAIIVGQMGLDYDSVKEQIAEEEVERALLQKKIEDIKSGGKKNEKK